MDNSVILFVYPLHVKIKAEGISILSKLWTCMFIVQAVGGLSIYMNMHYN